MEMVERGFALFSNFNKVGLFAGLKYLFSSQ
jgi:hypothetical protein